MKIGQKILLKFKEGKSPTQLINEGYNKNTVYKYWKLFEIWKELSEKSWELVFEGV